MGKGYFTLVLHGHLPFVRHPEHDFFLEETWLYEAITETYIPLINAMDRLLEDEIDFRITLSITPPLMSMLSDELLQSRYVRHIERLIELARKEVERTRWQAEFNGLARFYLDRFEDARRVFEEKYKRNLLSAFKKFQDAGKIEVITCGATHGYFPLMVRGRKESIRTQVRVAKQVYEKYIGQPPRGMWLPECAYNPGDDKMLAQEGIEFFFVDAHGILHGTPRPQYGVFAPVRTESGVAVFGRDMETSKQVWSAREGYPGDFYYRDFYRDIGFDLDFDYVKPYVHPDGIRIMTGIKYYRITGKTDHKLPYERSKAIDRAAEHAGNFIFNRERQIEYLRDFLGIKPIVVSMYDMELFGHWWFEGPEFLEFLFRKLHRDQIIEVVTPSEYLGENPTLQVVTPSMSSWGYKGYNESWLNGSNDWIYRHLHRAAERMIAIADDFKDTSDPMQIRALNQMARELLLAQSSDWAFIMYTGATRDYAVKRTKDHLIQFTKLHDRLRAGVNPDEGMFLSNLEWRNNIFPDIDFRVYCSDP
ncbi:MAG: glycoside hydrolase family 57 protein [bacterium]